MSTVVSLKSIVEELGILVNEATVYLNRRTGEIVAVLHEDMALVEDDEDAEELPDWQREWLSKVREVLESDDFLPLPSKFELDEYEIMREFCLSVEDDELRKDLLDAIHGSGAFQRFKNLIYRRGIEQSWYSYRGQALEAIAIEWLETHDIAYE